MKLPGLRSLLKENFLSGIFLLIPLWAVFWIVRTAFGFLWEFTQYLPAGMHPEDSGGWSAFGINALTALGVLLVFATAVSFLGWSSKFYLGKKLIGYLGDVIEKIPVAGAIYSSLDQLLKTLAAGGGKQFSRVVYLEYPRAGVWAIGFVTGPARGQNLPEGFLNVFVPTVPNPTSGFHLIVPSTEVKETGLTVEEAFKTILSLGIAQGGKS